MQESAIHSIFSARATGDSHPLTLAEQIAESIYLDIVNGHYQFGERVREDEVSRRYQVSRGPVREALRILEKDSVVVIQPHRGAHVTELTPQEVTDIFSIRKALIGLAIREFPPLSKDALAAMEAQVEAMAELVDGTEDGDAYARASADLHLFMASQSPNRRLVTMIRSLARQTFRYTQIALSDPQTRARSIGYWREIIRLLGAGRMSHAADLAEELIERSRLSAQKYLELKHTRQTTD